ncbi:LysM peptidoglycan-binding domain-containing protein [Halocella sp. SP3-1]|uniref:LysM peptidoglycan-binding domain-containing protein n=1 Tax=Halocella sp. SP3-1 TaxID=2382161 RepID=UPI000F75BC1B|nr:LysM peptidoglycan-binding domain-containing protein [Halocella sp. SP3-1]AZO94852.1 LysM peptidoglycan-binding domain-containing protein [Halocella sp. SP3-1]
MIDDKVVSNKRVVYKRDKRNDEDPGKFYLEDEKSGERIELIDFDWVERAGVKKNEAIAEATAARYTTLFRLTDEQVRFDAAADALEIVGRGMTYAEAYSNTAGALGENIANISVMALSFYTSSSLDYMYHDYFDDETDESEELHPSNKVDLNEGRVQKAADNLYLQILLLIGGEFFDQAEQYAQETLVKKYSSPDAIANLIKERGSDGLKSTKAIKTLMSEYFCNWGPAIIKLAPKVKHGGFATAGEYLAALNRELMLNRISGRVNMILLCLGVTLMKAGHPLSVMLGAAVVVSAQPVSMGVRKAAELKLMEKENDGSRIDETKQTDIWNEVLDTVFEEFKKQFNLAELFNGVSQMYLLCDLHTDDPRIAEFEIDAPGGIEGFEILWRGNVKSLANLDFKCLAKHEGIGDVSEFTNKIKGLSACYGTVESIGGMMNRKFEKKGNEAINQLDEDFVAFFDHRGIKSADVMRRIITDIFQKWEWDPYEHSYKEVIIKEGDTLEDIAHDHFISCEALRKANNLHENQNIKERATLKIPPLTKVPYEIKQGDSLSEIAVEYDTDVARLKRLNNLEGGTIYTGDILLVPLEIDWAYEDRRWTSFKNPEFNIIPRLIHKKKTKDIIDKHNFLFLPGYTVPEIKDHLKETSKHFPERYLKFLLEQGINVGIDTRGRVPFHQVRHISIIDRQANKFGIGLRFEDNKGYEEILELSHNEFFKEEGLYGNLFSKKEGDGKGVNYDYLIFKDPDVLLPHVFFKKNHDRLYGSLGKNKEELSTPEDPYQFTAGFGEEKNYKNSNGMGVIKLNGHTIGENIRFLRKTRYQGQLKEEYEENFYKEGTKKLMLKVNYTFTPQGKLDFNSLFDLYDKTELIIKYGSLGDGPAIANILEIDDFQNGDYGIELPRYHIISGTLYAKQKKEYSNHEIISCAGNDIKININSGKAYNYKLNQEDGEELYNQADRIIIGDKPIGSGINLHRETEEGIIEYRDDDQVKYEFSIKKDRLLIDLQNHPHIKEIYREELSKNIRDSKILDAILIENFKNGDYGLHLPYEHMGENFTLLVGSKAREEIEINQPHDYYIYSQKSYCNNEDCKLKKLCQERGKNSLGSEACFCKQYIFNELGYKAINGKGDLYIDGLRLGEMNIEKLTYIGGLISGYTFKKGLYELECRFEQKLNNDDKVDELLISYKGGIRGKNTGEWNHILIKGFQNGDYNINLPEVVVSYLPGSNYIG